MAIEGEAHGLEVTRVGELAHEPEHRLVAEVHAVVRADRDRRARSLGVTSSSATTSIGRCSPMRRRLQARPRPPGRNARPAALVDREQLAVGPITANGPAPSPAASATVTGNVIAVADGARLVGVDDERLELAHRVARRQHAWRRVGRDRVEVARVGLGVNDADAQPPQRPEVCEAAERGAEVGRQRADVRAAPALDVHGRDRIRAGDELLDVDPVDAHAARRALDLLPRTRELVRAASRRP